MEKSQQPDTFGFTDEQKLASFIRRRARVEKEKHAPGSLAYAVEAHLIKHADELVHEATSRFAQLMAGTLKPGSPEKET